MIDKDAILTGIIDGRPDEYAIDSIVKAIGNGTLKGDGNGNYKLHSNITIQDTIVILDRLGLIKGEI